MSRKVRKEGIFTTEGRIVPLTGRGGKVIRIKSPFVLDPLFSASGFLAHYVYCDTPYSGESFSFGAFDIEETLIFDLTLTWNGEGAEEVYHFVEKLAGFLQVYSGIPYSEVSLGREISLFEEALSLSIDLIDTVGEQDMKEREDLLKGWWSYPAGALVLALSGESCFLHDTKISRFPAELTLTEELNRLLRVVHSLRIEGPFFGLPPTCYVGEMVKCYMGLKIAERKDR